MELIIVAVVAFVIGWKLNEFFHLTAMFGLLKELNIKESDLRKVAERHGITFPDPEGTVHTAADQLEEIQIKVEQHGTAIYAFRADNDQFLGQGTDKDTLINHISKRLNNVRLTVIEGNEYLKSEA